MKLYSRDRARRSIFDTVGFRALSQLATILSFLVLVRGMSEHEFGVLNLLYSFIPVVITIGSLGLDPLLKRYQPEYLRAGQVEVAAWLFRKVRFLRLSSNIVIITVILLCWSWIAALFKLESYRLDFTIFCALLVVYFQVNLLQYSLASHMLHRYSVGSIAISSCAKLAGYAVLTQFAALTLRNAILVDLFAYGAGYVFLIRAHRVADKTVEGLSACRPGAAEVSRLKRFAAFSHFNDSAALLTNPEIDRFFVAALMSPIAVGTYAFYTRLNDMASSLVPLKLFENVVQPLFFGVPVVEAKEKISRYFTFLINLNLVYQLPLIAFTTVYHREIVSVAFGGKFLELSSLLPVVVAFAASDNVIAAPLTMVAQYKERASIVLFSQVVGVYQIAAMLVLVPFAGLYGAAIATGTYHLLRNLLVWRYVKDYAVWSNFYSVVIWSSLIWGVTIWFCVMLRDFVDMESLAKLLIGFIVCALATIVFIRSPAVCQSDRDILCSVFHGRESRFLKWIGISS